MKVRHFFLFLDSYCCADFQNLTDGRTNKYGFIGPPLKGAKYGDKTMININPFKAEVHTTQKLVKIN